MKWIIDNWPFWYMGGVLVFMYVYAKIIERKIIRGGPGW